MELPNPRTKVFTLLKDPQRTGLVLAALIGDGVAPPIKLDLCELEAEEDDDARNRDAAGPCRGKDKVILIISMSEVVHYEEMGRSDDNGPLTTSRRSVT